MVSAVPLNVGSPAWLEYALSDACGTDTRCWWVVHTKARNQKALAGELVKKEVAVYLPLVQASRSYGRRRTFVDLPLFPGYVFLFGTMPDRDRAYQTNRVANILEVHDQARIQKDLNHVRTILASEAAVEVFPGLRKGRMCRVVAGPLRGVSGVVEGTRRKRRLYVAATILGQSAIVEIDAAWVEAID